ncbi:MAG: hypothetical protein JO069_11710 [Verrucomicrobia bacterium]|nr:hypothetical protein [Verrucomicrobiota bacterium]
MRPCVLLVAFISCGGLAVVSAQNRYGDRSAAVATGLSSPWRPNPFLNARPVEEPSPATPVRRAAGLTYDASRPLPGDGASRSSNGAGPLVAPSRYLWKLRIVTTVFWVGEPPTRNNPVPNHRSAWDKHWTANYGGYDNPDPSARRRYIPLSFVPRQNPFYVALPYNDVEGRHTKPEAASVVPWFKDAFVRDGQTTLKGRWLAIRHGNRVCYAQWEDCGPFRTDHWQYVFGNERPRPNLNQGAGLDVSPAVRDYLSLASKDVCDWKFVESREVPAGPWRLYAGSNPFTLGRRGSRWPGGPIAVTKLTDRFWE